MPASRSGDRAGQARGAGARATHPVVGTRRRRANQGCRGGAGMTASVHEEIVLLRAQVDYLLGRVAEADGLGASPIAWCALDREQARQEWASLAGWVDWLIDRYALTETVPGCWYRHP